MNRTLIITEELAGSRLDVVIAKCYDSLSRSQIQKCILEGNVSLNGQPITSKRHIVSLNDSISFHYEEKTVCEDIPQAMDLDIVYEDDDLLVINKPFGLVVHPGAGNANSTLLNALIARYPSNNTLPQAGLIHRLDKDTTGLLLIAKNNLSYLQLNRAMAKREIQRTYTALVNGIVHAGGTIDEPLARHPKHRTKYTTHHNGRSAVTHYSVIERFINHTLLKVKLETGRTHQIRVHMLHINHPIVGDQLYTRQTTPKKNTISDIALNALSKFKRQALHATSLCFIQPTTKETIDLSIPLPEDFQRLLESLRQ